MGQAHRRTKYADLWSRGVDDDGGMSNVADGGDVGDVFAGAALVRDWWIERFWAFVSTYSLRKGRGGFGGVEVSSDG